MPPHYANFGHGLGGCVLRRLGACVCDAMGGRENLRPFRIFYWENCQATGSEKPRDDVRTIKSRIVEDAILRQMAFHGKAVDRGIA